MWDLGSWPPAQLIAFPKSDDQVGWAAFSPDGTRVATVGGNQSVHVFSADDGRELMTLAGHGGFVFRVAFSPDGGQVVTVSNDATVRVWDLTAKAELFSLSLPTRAQAWGAFDLAFRTTSAGDSWIAVPLFRGRLVIYHLPKIYDMSAIKPLAASTPPAAND